jgi:hypothetical protein
VLDSNHLTYQPKYKFQIASLQKRVVVDYRVDSPDRHSSILTLVGSHSQAIEVFRKWYDLRDAKIEDRLITIYDDTRYIERIEDLHRLKKLSDVVSISNPREIARLLNPAA